VLVKTFSLAIDPTLPDARRRIETRLLTRQAGQWAGYSYIWNDEQTDATLVAASGQDRVYTVADPKAPGGKRQQTWHYPSRAECMVCHSRAANFVLGLSVVQMNKDHDYGGTTANQLRTLEHLGIFSSKKGGGASKLPKRPKDYPHLVDPFDARADLDARARSYLHANCSQCHVHAGGGNSQIELEFTAKPDRMNLFDVRPMHQVFDLADARLVASGNPERSILYQRVARRGPGQMPPLASSEVDRQAVELLRNWISQLKPSAEK
jgi:hypothetical protein